MTLKTNRALLLFYVKLCASFQIHRWIQTGVTVRKHPIWVYRHTATVQDKCSLKTKSTASNIRIFLMKTWYNKTKWYHSIVLRKVHQFIIKNPCASSKAILQNPRFTPQVHTNTSTQVYGSSIRFTTQVLSPHALQSPWHTIYNLNWNQNRQG